MATLSLPSNRPTIVVCGSGTDAGKTFVACRLVEDLVAEGYAVAVRKPVVSGFVDDDESGDSARLMAAAQSGEGLDVVSPWRFPEAVAPDAAARGAGVVVDFDAVVASCAASPAFDVVVTETAGGVMSPLTAQQTQLDLVVALQAPTILVLDASYLGHISHGLSAWHCLAMRGVNVVAVVVNRGPSESLRRFLPTASVFEVSERQPLAARIKDVLALSLSKQPKRCRVP